MRAIANLITKSVDVRDVDVIPAESLEDLADEVNREGALLQREQESMLARAFRIGDLLNEAKRRIPHGEFGKWCEEKITLSDRHCRRFMLLARQMPERTRVSVLDSDDSIRSVYATLAGPGDELDEKKSYWTVEEWKALPQRIRDRIIESARNAESGRSFNRQDDNSDDAMGNIEWARWSWNPVTGCRHNCPYCYARDITARFTDTYPTGFEPTFWPDRLANPQHTAIPSGTKTDVAWRNVFSNSMSDLYGRWVPDEWINAVLSVMREHEQWNFLMLTKFPKKAAEFSYAKNCWIGTSVDLQARVKSAEDAFERLECGVRWLSLEPLLEPLKFSRPELFNWVVIGGSSRSSKTPAWTPPSEWIVRVASQFLEHGTPVYLKTNGRPREYPGVVTPERAADVFYYLKQAAP